VLFVKWCGGGGGGVEGGCDADSSRKQRESYYSVNFSK